MTSCLRPPLRPPMAPATKAARPLRRPGETCWPPRRRPGLPSRNSSPTVRSAPWCAGATTGARGTCGAWTSSGSETAASPKAWPTSRDSATAHQASRLPAGRAGLAAGDLTGALLTQRTQVHGSPGAVGPPRLRDFGEGAAGPVPFGDLGVQPSFVAGQRVGGVRAADHDQFGGERPEALDLLHTLDGLAGVNSTQRRPVQQPIESRLGDRSQIRTLAARKIQ